MTTNIERFFDDISHRIDSVFDGFPDLDAMFDFGRIPATAHTTAKTAHTTSYSVGHVEGGVLITVEVPGLSFEDIEMHLVNGILTIEAEGSERKFKMRFRVGRNRAPEDITASVKHGLLTVMVAHDHEAKPEHKIKVGEG